MLDQGVAHPGTAYQTHRWRELVFFIDFLLRWTESPAKDRANLLANPWDFSDWLDTVEGAPNRQLPHVLFFLLFPDEFEPITSRGHKQRIITAFAGRLADPRAAEYRSRTELDKAILLVREAISEDCGADFDFYQDELAKIWKPTAARLHNVQGVLLGEAVTAARDAARPLVTKEALEPWASKQAEMIGASVKDEERQARSAEVVLECGGEIGYLKFVKWGSDWLTPSEFEEQLRSSTEIAISFDGEFDYDEDQDDVHPREFREDFTISERIALVLKHDGGILEIGNNSWPRSVTGQPKRNVSNAAAYIGDLIRRAWGENIHEDEEERVVGKVGGFDITRQLIVFRVANEEKPF